MTRSGSEVAGQPDMGDRRPDIGTQADSPTQIPARAWWEVLGRAIRESQQDKSHW